VKILVCTIAVAAAFWPWQSTAQPNRASGEVRGAKTKSPESTNAACQDAGISQNGQTDEFEILVRRDFLDGLAGDRAAFDRAMKLCSATLAQHPRHASALVWHGSGLVFLAMQAFAARDLPNGTNFWQRGMAEMDNAAALEPENVAVLLPRGRTLLGVSRHAPDAAQARALLQTGIGDYEKALQLQKPRFQTLSLQARGQLLFGLADGWHRLGNASRAGFYFQRVLEDCGGSSYAEQARIWVETKDPSALADTPQAAACIACHGK
jgi:hypothetical protein